MIVDPSLVWCGSPKIVEVPDSPRNRSTASRISMISIVASKPQHCASIDRWPSGGIRAGASSDGGRRSCWPGFSFSSAQAQSTRPSQNPQPGIGHFSQSGFSRRSDLPTAPSKRGETGTNLSRRRGKGQRHPPRYPPTTSAAHSRRPTAASRQSEHYANYIRLGPEGCDGSDRRPAGRTGPATPIVATITITVRYRHLTATIERARQGLTT